MDILRLFTPGRSSPVSLLNQSARSIVNKAGNPTAAKKINLFKLFTIARSLLNRLNRKLQSARRSCVVVRYAGRPNGSARRQSQCAAAAHPTTMGNFGAEPLRAKPNLRDATPD